MHKKAICINPQIIISIKMIKEIPINNDIFTSLILGLLGVVLLSHLTILDANRNLV